MGGALVQGLLGFFGGAAQGAHEKIGIDSERKHTFSLEDVRHRNTIELEQFRQDWEKQIRAEDRVQQGIQRAEERGYAAIDREHTETREDTLAERTRVETAAETARREALEERRRGEDKTDRREEADYNRTISSAERLVEDAEDAFAQIISAYAPDVAMQAEQGYIRGGANDYTQNALAMQQKAAGDEPTMGYAAGGTYSYTSETPRDVNRVVELIVKQSEEEKDPRIAEAARVLRTASDKLQDAKAKLAGMTFDSRDSLDIDEFKQLKAMVREAVTLWNAAQKKYGKKEIAPPPPPPVGTRPPSPMDRFRTEKTG